LGETRAGQIDQADWWCGVDERHESCHELMLTYGVDAGATPKRLDERAVKRFGGVEHAVPVEWIVEATRSSRSEKQGIMFKAVDSEPGAGEAHDRQPTIV